MLSSILNWFKRKKHARDVRDWRHKNNIIKSVLEMYNNMLYMRKYRCMPGWKEHHRKYMRLWRQEHKNEIQR